MNGENMKTICIIASLLIVGCGYQYDYKQTLPPGYTCMTNEHGRFRIYDENHINVIVPTMRPTEHECKSYNCAKDDAWWLYYERKTNWYEYTPPTNNNTSSSRLLL